MRFLLVCLGLWSSAMAAVANPDVDRLIDAMGMPAMVRAFSNEGILTSTSLDAEFLNGQGGAVWEETVRKLYDPARLESELRIGLSESLEPDVARTALIFFESELGARIISLEVQAREAMLDNDVAYMAKAAGEHAGEKVRDFLELRDLVERNADAAISAQGAFFDGFAQASNETMTAPDIEAMRPAMKTETETWLMGYYTLVQSALSDADIETYSNFWRTEVGAAVDDAVFNVFGVSYTNLSFALGQAAGLLSPASEL